MIARCWSDLRIQTGFSHVSCSTEMQVKACTGFGFRIVAIIPKVHRFPGPLHVLTEEHQV